MNPFFEVMESIAFLIIFSKAHCNKISFPDILGNGSVIFSLIVIFLEKLGSLSLKY